MAVASTTTRRAASPGRVLPAAVVLGAGAVLGTALSPGHPMSRRQPVTALFWAGHCQDGADAEPAEPGW